MQKFFNIEDQTKIYILAPAGVVTGGVELLHQLCNVLNRNGQHSFIVYIGENKHEIPNDYKKYKISLMEFSSIDDSEKNILVVPETTLQYLKYVSNIKILVWWLSVDNYFAALQGSVLETFKFFFEKKGILSGIKSVIRKLLKPYAYPTYNLKKIHRNKNILCHAYQSEYAADFLRKNHFENLFHLSDYINVDFINSQSLNNKKDNIIIYNPKKGLKFTKKLINFSSDLNWLPIENMTREDVKKLMSRAKLYIDFGHHPGKDRMPREAAMSGCCIITGKLGAAGFQEDLLIDENEYKFNQSKKDIPLIIQKIRNVLNDYENEIIKFSNYRKSITEEKTIFEKEAIMLLTSKK